MLQFVITTGLLKLVDHDELSAVIAYEKGHMQYRDTPMMTVVATLAGALCKIANRAIRLGYRA